MRIKNAPGRVNRRRVSARDRIKEKRDRALQVLKDYNAELKKHLDAPKSMRPTEVVESIKRNIGEYQAKVERYNHEILKVESKIMIQETADMRRTKKNRKPLGLAAPK